MNNKFMTVISTVTLISGLTASPAAFALDTAQVNRALAGSTVLELPVKAASLVSQASPAEQSQTAAAAVKAALSLSPSAAVSVVSAMSRQTPSTAPVVAVTASAMQHRHLAEIAKAASTAAPAQAPEIVSALIKQYPQDYGVIAKAAAEGAPIFARQILAAVGENIPALKKSIQTAVAKTAEKTSASDVPVILADSYNEAVSAGISVTPVLLVANTAMAPVGGASLTSPGSPTAPPLGGPKVSGPVVSPPTLGAPYTTPPGPPTIYTPGDTVQGGGPGRGPYGSP